MNDETEVSQTNADLDAEARRAGYRCAYRSRIHTMACPLIVDADPTDRRTRQQILYLVQKGKKDFDLIRNLILTNSYPQYPIPGMAHEMEYRALVDEYKSLKTRPMPRKYCGKMKEMEKRYKRRIEILKRLKNLEAFDQRRRREGGYEVANGPRIALFSVKHN